MTYIEEYLKAVGMFRNYADASQDPVFSEVVELDLSTVVPSLSGPKRPHDRVSVSEMKVDFQKCLDNKVRHGHSLSLSLSLSRTHTRDMWSVCAQVVH